MEKIWGVNICKQQIIGIVPSFIWKHMANKKIMFYLHNTTQYIAIEALKVRIIFQEQEDFVHKRNK